MKGCLIRTMPKLIVNGAIGLMQPKIGKRQKFGDWTLKKHLGDGGNGCVWKAINSQCQEAAIKLLVSVGSKPYTRFKDEINIISKNSDIMGILPILGFYLPSDNRDEIPWYVMPIAEPMSEYLGEKYFEDTLYAITEIARTLLELHKRNITHRDIKPENLLVRDGKFFVGDFGLVDYPDKVQLTSAGENVGAKWTMAPEMRRNGDKADGKPADVYSLAKTLWILLTKVNKGFDGQYFADGINGLKNFPIIRHPSFNNDLYGNRKLEFTKPLDDLLFDCTNDEPTSRPSMRQFFQRITEIAKAIDDDFLMWQAIQNKLFPLFAPVRAVWDDINDIVKILGLLCSYEINHMLYPDGGGLDLGKAALGKEPDTIELIPTGQRSRERVELVKPRKLVFEGFGSNFEWNYFRLETEGLEPTDVDIVHKNCEEVVETEDLCYIKRLYWEEGIYDNKKLPSTARLVRRYLRGIFLIVQKSSVYNSFEAYVGLHNQMTTDDFKDYVSQKFLTYNQILADAEVEAVALENDMTPRDLAISYLREEARKEYLDNFEDFE